MSPESRFLGRGTGYRVWAPNNRDIEYADFCIGGDGSRRSPAMNYDSALVCDTQLREQYRQEGLDPRLVSLEYLGHVWIVISSDVG